MLGVFHVRNLLYEPPILQLQLLLLVLKDEQLLPGHGQLVVVPAAGGLVGQGQVPGLL